MHTLVGIISVLCIVGVMLGAGLGTNYATANTDYATPDCCAGPEPKCNPCTGGTSTMTPPTTTPAP